MIHSMYMSRTCAAADAKHQKTLNWVYFDELRLIAYIGAVSYGTDGVWWLSCLSQSIIRKWQCCTWDLMS